MQKQELQDAGREHNKKSNYRSRLLENPFLVLSNEQIDEFFANLSEVPSPRREEQFLSFCLSFGDTNNKHPFLVS